MSRETPADRVTPDEFFRADIRVGKVVSAEEFPGARKAAYKLRIDFGPLGEKRSSARITAHYTPEELVGRLVIAVTNFPPRQIATFMSEVLVLGYRTAAPETPSCSPPMPRWKGEPGTTAPGPAGTTGTGAPVTGNPNATLHFTHPGGWLTLDSPLPSQTKPRAP